MQLLFPLFLVIRAPGSIGTLRTMASTAPVPLATIAEEDIHTQVLLDLEPNFIYPAWPFRVHEEIIKPWSMERQWRGTQTKLTGIILVMEGM